MIFSKRFIQSKIFFMETMINLNDLLKHEILDLYSVEEQIIEAMPGMIEKAKNPELKKALREHLKITEEQKSRLDKVKSTFGEPESEGENKGFFSRLFGGSNGGEKCKGMEGIIGEGEKIMTADITDEALDAAIIASAQKIEHYEICGYGTARAFARELNLPEVERLLTQTLNEEYEADDRLTSLAVGKLNLEAEQATGMESGSAGGGGSRSGGSGGGANKGGSRSGGSKPGGSGSNSSKGSASKSGSSKGGGSKTGGSKGGSSKGGGSKSRGSKGGSSKGSGTKSGSKGGSKGRSKSGAGSRGSSKGSSKGRSKSGRR
jgi:ferritin-like metal-binding protein YciE